MLIPQRVKAKRAPSLRSSTKILVYIWAISLFGLGVAWGDTVWKEASSQEDHFSVAMPGDATFKSYNINGASGPLEMHSWTAMMDPPAAFVTMVNQYPASQIAKVGPELLLDNVQKGQMGSDGKLISSTKIQVQGYPGRDVVIEKPQFTANVRVVLAQTRLYQLIVTVEHSRESAIASDVKKYFDSFKLVNEK